jgi:outer membrane receptor for ferrienterochelin and colicin
MSITAITGDDIQERGFTGFAGIIQSVPGVAMRTSGPGQTEIEMRGMTSAGGNSSTVGFYLDDTPLTAPANAQNGKVVIDPSLYDLNRVEVLRGQSVERNRLFSPASLLAAMYCGDLPL